MVGGGVGGGVELLGMGEECWVGLGGWGGVGGFGVWVGWGMIREKVVSTMGRS